MRNYKLYLFVLVALLPVLLLRDYTPSNELRYLSIADEAIANRTFFTFTNHGIPYADKPPLYLWIVMLGKSLFGTHCMAFLALFSLLPAFVIVEVMDRWTARELDPAFRPTARLLLLTCGLFLGMLVTLRMDMLMCMFITLALYTFHRMETGKISHRKGIWLFPLYVFLAVFSKGPMGILVPLAATLVYLLITGRIRRFGRYWGWQTWGLLLLGCALWFGAVYAEGGNAYLNNLLFHQTIDRAVNSFHHEKPFYYYGLAIWYAMLPWSLLLIGGVAVAAWRGYIRTDVQKLFLTTAVTTFVMLSCISSKIEVYLLPLYPFLTYLAVGVLPRFRQSRWPSVAAGVPILVLTLALFVLWGLSGREDLAFLNQGWIYAAAGVLTLTGAGSLYLLYRRELNRALQLSATGLFVAVFAGGWALPQLNEEMGYARLCEKAAEMAKKHGATDFYTWKVSRAENMDVYLHRNVNIITREDAPPQGLQKAVLMMRKKDLHLYPEQGETCIVGRYAVVIPAGRPVPQDAPETSHELQPQSNE